MNIKFAFMFRSLILLVFITCTWSCSIDKDEDFTEEVKVSLREVGHRLLLSNQDSTSLVKPVLKIDKFKYQLSFDNSLSIHPDSLVSLVKSSFDKSKLPKYYLTEVLNCEDDEVAYSYAMNEDVEKGIIPCRGRQLSSSCYLINVRFTQLPKDETSNLIYLYLFGIVLLIIVVGFYFKRKFNVIPKSIDSDFSSIGTFKFYPDQNKLVKQATEISLSKKECELLAIFVAHANQVVKRDLLTKQVWEDQGVIVGRSLDTYISKLRKKLQDDDSIKLINVHGVGYKLEISK